MGKVILENLIPLVFTVLTPLVVLLINKALNALAKKWKLEDALKYEAKVDELILKGIKAVEQKAINAVKSNDGRTAGAAKLDMVLQFVNAQLKQHKLDEKAASELTMLVEARIFDGANKQLPVQ